MHWQLLNALLWNDIPVPQRMKCEDEFVSVHRGRAELLPRSHLRLPAVLLLFKTLADIFSRCAATWSSPRLKSLHWLTVIWTILILCVRQMGEITDWIKLSLREPTDDSPSDLLSAETVSIMPPLARHPSIYQQRHSLLVEKGFLRFDLLSTFPESALMVPPL